MRLQNALRLCPAAAAMLFLAMSGPLAGQGSERPSGADAALIDLNRRLFETMILAQSADLLLEVSDDSYVVVAPGGVIESRAQAIRGLSAFATVDSITITNERAISQGLTAIVLSRLQIHGRIQGPVGQVGPMSVMTVFRDRGDAGWGVVSRALTPCNPMAIERGIC